METKVNPTEKKIESQKFTYERFFTRQEREVLFLSIFLFGCDGVRRSKISTFGFWENESLQEEVEFLSPKRALPPIIIF